jgi:acyl carrier protein
MMQNNSYDEQKLRSEIWECLINSIDSVLDTSKSIVKTPSSNIRDDIGLSSLNTIIVLFNLEDKYDINLVDVPPQQIITLKDVEDTVFKLFISKGAIVS